MNSQASSKNSRAPTLLYTNSFKKSAGLTLMELLIVIALIALLSGIVFVYLGGVRAHARDAIRISAIKDFTTALERYYFEYGKYPGGASGGTGPYGFTYRASDCTSASPSLYFDNSESSGFLDDLYNEGFLNQQDWKDPLNPSLGSRYNCRYIWSRSEGTANNVQNYFLHCALETNNTASQQDAGTHSQLLESFSGGSPPWLCVTDIP